MLVDRRTVSALTSLLTTAALLLGSPVPTSTAAPVASGHLGSPTTMTVESELQAAPHKRRNRLRHHYYYDPELTAVRRMVRQAAARWDVNPHLALAIAWQESGWQQNVRSSSGAIGIMQVLPSTGRWVDAYLVKRDLDIRRSTDNVVAGMAYIDWLQANTYLNRRVIAGYYQGLASVRRNHMYKSTRAYVASVRALRYRSRHGGIVR